MWTKLTVEGKYCHHAIVILQVNFCVSELLNKELASFYWFKVSYDTLSCKV